MRYQSIVGSTAQAALAVCSLVKISPQFAQVLIIIDSAEQTALAVRSMVKASLQ